MLTRLTIVLTEEERAALQVIAEREMRGLRDQVRYLVRDELERLQLLPLTRNDADTQAGTTVEAQHGN